MLSIITVCYNSEKTIEKCIDSVISQIDEEVEYIIVDGKSTDKTVDIIKNFSKHLKYISEKDEGIYDAMNKGIKMATGEWILFINSDDCLLNNKLEGLLDILHTYENLDCIYGNICEAIRYEDSEYIHIYNPPDNLYNLKNDMVLSHPSCICKKETLVNNGCFNKKFKIAADWDLLLRMKNNGAKFKKIDYTFSKFYFGGASGKSHIFERHIIRKNNNSYRIIDFKFFIDFLHSLELRKKIYEVLYKKNSTKMLLKSRGFVKQ